MPNLQDCAETEWALPSVRLLENWLLRGFFQVFTALLTLELSRSTAPGQTDVHKSLKLYRIVAGSSLGICGGMYILRGMLCWGRQKAKGAPHSFLKYCLGCNSPWLELAETISLGLYTVFL